MIGATTLKYDAFPIRMHVHLSSKQNGRPSFFGILCARGKQLLSLMCNHNPCCIHLAKLAHQVLVVSLAALLEHRSTLANNRESPKTA